MKALVIGGTGATGRDLINVLLRDQDYTEVVLFVRRGSGMVHPKLREVLTEFDKLNEVNGEINGDVLFSCLGTTLKAAGSKEKQWHIDYEIPLTFAGIAKTNGIRKMVLLSAYGASTKSRVFYSKLKGNLEDGIAALTFDQFIIFRPGILVRKNTDRFGERIMVPVLTFMNTIGLIKKYKPLPTLLLAEKLAKAPKILRIGKHVVALNDIFSF